MDNLTTMDSFDSTLVEKQMKGIQAMVESTQVANDGDLAEVADKISKIKKVAKFVREEMERYTKPAQFIINTARERFLPYEKECKDAELTLKGKASMYMVALEQQKKKEEEKIARALEAGRIKESTAERKLEAVVEAPQTIQTKTGSSLTMKTVKKAYIIEPEKVPHEYWLIDEVRVKRAALAGAIIPGVEVREEKEMSSR